MLALLKVTDIVASNAVWLNRLALHTLDFDALFTFTMPPPETLDLRKLKLFIVNLPLTTTDGDLRLTIWKVEFGKVDLCRRVWRGCCFGPQRHSERAVLQVEQVA